MAGVALTAGDVSVRSALHNRGSGKVFFERFRSSSEAELNGGVPVGSPSAIGGLFRVSTGDYYDYTSRWLEWFNSVDRDAFTVIVDALWGEITSRLMSIRGPTASMIDLSFLTNLRNRAETTTYANSVAASKGRNMYGLRFNGDMSFTENGAVQGVSLGVSAGSAQANHLVTPGISVNNPATGKIFQVYAVGRALTDDELVRQVYSMSRISDPLAELKTAVPWKALYVARPEYLTLSGSDVDAWAPAAGTSGLSLLGGDTNAVAGMNPPSYNTGAFDGTERGVSFASANSESLHQDGFAALFGPVTNRWTVVLRVVPQSDGIVLSAAGAGPSNLRLQTLAGNWTLEQDDGSTSSVAAETATTYPTAQVVAISRTADDTIQFRWGPALANVAVQSNSTLTKFALGALVTSTAASQFFDGDIQTIGLVERALTDDEFRRLVPLLDDESSQDATYQDTIMALYGAL